MKQHTYDLIIIGAGPGGIQTALTYKELCLEQNISPNMLILEASDSVGHSFRQYPVHGKLISNNKLYTGAPYTSRFAEKFDWNSLITKDKEILMRNYSKEFYPPRETVVDMLNDLVEKYELPVMTETKWLGTSKNEEGNFEINTSKGFYYSKNMVVATGLEPVTPNIDGIEHVTMYKDMKSKEYYRDKRVLILGKGNSGTECAQDIINEANVIMLASPSTARLAYKTHYVGSIRAVNSIIAENYQLKHQAALLDCEVLKIEKVDQGFNVEVKYIHAEDEVETLFFNEVVAATGFKSCITSLINDFGIKQLHNKFPSINGVFESTEVPNLFFAGAQTHGLDFRSTSTSGFIHGFRYNSKILAAHIAAKNNIVSRKVEIKQDVIDFILSEFNESPDLWLQPGYVGHLLLLENETWYSLGYRTHQEFKELNTDNNTLVFLTLEYGDIHKFTEPFNIPRSPGNSDESVHIHPIIRIKQQETVTLTNLEEHLESRFEKDKYYSEIQHVLNTIKDEEREIVHQS